MPPRPTSAEGQPFVERVNWLAAWFNNEMSHELNRCVVAYCCPDDSASASKPEALHIEPLADERVLPQFVGQLDRVHRRVGTLADAMSIEIEKHLCARLADLEARFENAVCELESAYRAQRRVHSLDYANLEREITEAYDSKQAGDERMIRELRRSGELPLRKAVALIGAESWLRLKEDACRAEKARLESLDQKFLEEHADANDAHSRRLRRTRRHSLARKNYCRDLCGQIFDHLTEIYRTIISNQSGDVDSKPRFDDY